MFVIYGGGIEIGIFEFVVGLVGNEYLYYIFEGLKKVGNVDFYIIFIYFDEFYVLIIILKEDYVVFFYGYNDKNKKYIKIGGVDKVLRFKVYEVFVFKGFSIEILLD